MKKKNILTSSFVVALASATICTPAAMAAPTDIDQTKDQTQLISETLGINSITDFERIVSKDTVEVKAELKIVGKTSSEDIEITDGSKTLGKVLEELGHDYQDYRTSENEAIDEDLTFKDGDHKEIFKSEMSGSSNVITLKAPVEKVETDELFEGEEEVKEKGRDGKAVKTVINSTNLASDEKINVAASDNKTKTDNSSEEKLTVLKTPKAKVVLVGTKERTPETLNQVEDVQEETVSSNTDSSTNTYTVTTPSESRGSRVATSTQSHSPRNDRSTSPTRTNTSNRISSTPAPSPSPSVSVKPSNSNDGANSSISKLALAQLGKPYVWGATGPSSFDCSGFIYWLKAQQGKSVPRTSGGQWTASTPISGSQLKAGDILWKPGHIAIYIGDGKTVHASSPTTGVIMGSASDMLSRGYKAGRL